MPCACLLDFLGERPNELERARHHVLWDILLVGKIDAGLDQSERLDQSLPPALGALAKQASEVLIGLPALRLGFGCD
jgi:hypothetical protein